MTPTTAAGRGEELLRRRFAQWEFGAEWNAALDDALAEARAALLAEVREEVISLVQDAVDKDEVAPAWRVLAILDALEGEG